MLSASKVASVSAMLVPVGGPVFVLGVRGREVVPASSSVPGGDPPVIRSNAPSGMPQAFFLIAASWSIS